MYMNLYPYRHINIYISYILYIKYTCSSAAKSNFDLHRNLPQMNSSNNYNNNSSSISNHTNNNSSNNNFSEQNQQQYARVGVEVASMRLAACPTLHAVRDSCSAIKVKFVNLQFSSKRRLLVDWTHLFSAHNSAEFNRVTVTLTPVADCRRQSEDCGQWTGYCRPREAVAPLAFLN